MAMESTLGYTNTSLGTQNYKVAWVYMMPRADTITHLGFRYGARTSTPPQHTISLQGVDGSGNPDGTILGGGSPASATFTPPADTTWDGTWQWVSLANSYTTTRGQMVAVVVDATSNPASGSSSFTRVSSSWLSYIADLPYSLTYTGSWSKGGGYYPIFGLKSASYVYGVPHQSAGTQTTSTSGNRLACKFTLPSGWGSTFQVIGFRIMSNAGGNVIAGVGGTFKIGLWNAAGTALQAASAFDSDQLRRTGGPGDFYFKDSSLATLSFGTAYYIGLECESSNTIRMMTLDMPSANDFSGYALGTNACFSSWNGSAWSDTTTSRPWLDLILEDITPPAGGGGGLLTHPGMTGGIRG